MTPKDIDTLAVVASDVDAFVFDQWGVLHDGSTPYPYAVEALRALKGLGKRMAVLSNSGKRSEPNARRIANMGFDPSLFECVMTSGEALWRDIKSKRLTVSSLYPITRAPGDAEVWADGLDTVFDGVGEAEAVLLMGLPDDADPAVFDHALSMALDRDLPVLCSNPDRASPRADGAQVISPGALAHDYASKGGTVQFYGKPYLPVFKAVEIALSLAPDRILMVGDSLEHDIAGASNAGWKTAFVRGGLHRAVFAAGDISGNLAALARSENAPLPDYTLELLK